MTEVQVQGGSLVACLVSMFVISWASGNDLTVLLAAAGVLLALSLAVLTALRYFDLEEDS